MKLIFSGKTKDFTPDLQKKFSAKLAKLSKLVERRGEKEAHVMHQVERHLHKVEVIVNFYDHALIGEGSDADLDKALIGAATKLEKQVLKTAQPLARYSPRRQIGAHQQRKLGSEETPRPSSKTAGVKPSAKATPKPTAAMAPQRQTQDLQSELP